MIIIAITGTIGAGKGIVAEYLKTKGFSYYSARDFILEDVQRRNLEPNRDNIRLVANDLRKTHFPGYIIGELLARAKIAGTPAIIESIRSLGELQLLRELAPGFILLAVDADIKTRYARIIARGSPTDHVSFEKFVEDERREMVSSEPWDMNIAACMKAADITLENNVSLEALHQKIDKILATVAPTSK